MSNDSSIQKVAVDLALAVVCLTAVHYTTKGIDVLNEKRKARKTAKQLAKVEAL